MRSMMIILNSSTDMEHFGFLFYWCWLTKLMCWWKFLIPGNAWRVPLVYLSRTRVTLGPHEAIFGSSLTSGSTPRVHFFKFLDLEIQKKVMWTIKKSSWLAGWYGCINIWTFLFRFYKNQKKHLYHIAQSHGAVGCSTATNWNKG